MTEEKSLSEFLNEILPRIGFESHHYVIITHQGWQDLLQSIPRKIKAWGNPTPTFFILIDQDQADCRERKRQVQAACAEALYMTPVIRIVCRMLEAWFFGDTTTLINLSGINPTVLNKRIYRIPDDISHPKNELIKLFSYKTVSFSREMGKAITIEPDISSSISYGVFLRKIRELCPPRIL